MPAVLSLPYVLPQLLALLGLLFLWATHNRTRRTHLVPAAASHPVGDLRRSPRYCLELPVEFSANGTEDVGHTCNLSGEGCRIRSQKKFNKGDYLSVQLCLPKPDWPLTIEFAVVRWGDRE